MNIYELVNNVCKKNAFDLNTSGVQRLVGTLRSAGFSDTLSALETTQAQQILEKRLQAVSSPTLRTAANASVAPISSLAKFEEIDSFRTKNVCPRCKSKMERVKLAKYEKAAYCPTCKVALWTD